jgi:CHASE2 domain-containing sensor protein
MRVMTRENKMEVGQIWAFGTQLAVTLSASVGWLIICRLLHNTRARIRVTLAYLIAAAVALLTCMLYADSPTWSGFVASLLVMGFLYVRWKRSLTRQSLNTGTIIGFELT